MRQSDDSNQTMKCLVLNDKFEYQLDTCMEFNKIKGDKDKNVGNDNFFRAMMSLSIKKVRQP